MDIVNDVYQDDSLKSHERGLRGDGVRINKVKSNTKLPTNWNSFLEYLAEEVVSQMKDDGNIILFTTGDQVRSVPDGSYSTLQPCNQEKADTWMFIHIDDAVNSGYTHSSPELKRRMLWF